MVPNAINIFINTPIWVWVVFAYLIIAGIQSSKSRTVPLYRLTIMPLIFLSWSIIAICLKFSFLAINILPLISLWLIALLTGTFLGYKLTDKLKIKCDIDNGLIYLPGSFVPLILSLSFFIIKYFFGVICALNPLILKNLIFISFNMIFTGIIAGISTGRFIYILQKYRSNIACK